jgi:hypothetical protein
MTDCHSIVPPRELVEQWVSEKDYDERDWLYELHIANCASQWGADQQLAKDAKWLDHNALNEPHLRITPVGEALKEAMRPKPLCLKKQALLVLDEIASIDAAHYNVLRHAIEALPE